MKSIFKKAAAILMAVLVLLPVTAAGGEIEAWAGELSDETYLSLGADLTEEEQRTVLQLLGVDAEALEQYDVVYTTNAEEHEYLDAYVDYGKIGDRALSSVLIENAAEGSGIQVETFNVTYCTTGMYQNALATAGIDDVKVIVAGPYEVSGTAALVGAIKAYSEMNGENISEETIDAAVDEIVTTGELVQSVEADNANIEGLMAYLKEQVAGGNTEDMDTIIAEGADRFNIQLTDEQQAQLKELLEKLGSIDLDLSVLQSQAQSIYDKLSGMGLDLSDIHIDINADEAKGFFQKIIDFFKGLFS